MVQNLLTADSEFDNMETTNDHNMSSSDDHMDSNEEEIDQVGTYQFSV